LNVKSYKVESLPRHGGVKALYLTLQVLVPFGYRALPCIKQDELPYGAFTQQGFVWYVVTSKGELALTNMLK